MRGEISPTKLAHPGGRFGQRVAEPFVQQQVLRSWQGSSIGRAAES